MRLRTTWMVVSCGVVSTVASLAAGLIMYLEGLVVIEHTVEETGRADLQAIAREGRASFETTENSTARIGDMLNNLDNYPDYESFSKWMAVRSIAEIYRSNVLSGAGMLSFSTDKNQSRRIMDLLWYDLHRDRSRHYVHAQANALIDTPSCGYPCVVAFAIPDPNTAARGPNIYNFTTRLLDDPNVNELLDTGIAPGTSWWSNPLIWFSSDGNPYVYLINLRLLPLSPRHSILSGMQSIAKSDMLTEHWRKLMAKYTTEAKVLITQVASGRDSIVLTGNFPEAEVDKDCKAGFQQEGLERPPCLKYVLNLTEEFQKLVGELNNTANGHFRRGSSYWMMKDYLFLKGNSRGALDDIYLMWFRSISSVNGQLNRALFLLIAFSVLVASFDLMIGSLEIFFIAKPLGRLAESTVPLCRLDLVAANKLIDPCLGSFIAECQDLANGLAFATASLDEYKAFLPKSLFSQSEDSDGSPAPSQNSSKPSSQVGDSNSSRTSKKPQHVAGPAAALRVGLAKTPLTAIKVKLSDAIKEKSFIEALSVMESVVSSHRGTLHQFYVADPSMQCATWQGVSSSVIERCCQVAIHMKEMKHHAVIISEPGCRSGNLGSSTIRSFAVTGVIEKVIGPMLDIAMWLGAQSSSAVILTSKGCAVKVQSSIKTSVLLSARIHLELHTLSEIVGQEQVQQEEWMYTMETGGTGNVIANLKNAGGVITEKDLVALQSEVDKGKCSPSFKYMLKLAQTNVGDAFMITHGAVQVGDKHLSTQCIPT